MAKRKVSKAEFKKALEIGRPPNIKRLFPNSKAVIPAKAGIQLRSTGFRVKPGMTKKGRDF